MANDGPFGMDPDDFDRVVRETGEGLRDAFDRLGRFFAASGTGGGWSSVFDEFTRPAARPQPETTGDTGDGVWVIYTVDSAGSAHIEQVYRTELEALRVHKDNTDPARRVRFLPYGMAASVLDADATG